MATTLVTVIKVGSVAEIRTLALTVQNRNATVQLPINPVTKECCSFQFEASSTLVENGVTVITPLLGGACLQGGGRWLKCAGFGQTGPQGPEGPEGPQGPPGTPAPIPAHAAEVIVDPAGNGDSTTLSGGLTVLAARSGGRLHLKKGTYTLGASETVPAFPVEIVGEGKATVIDFTFAGDGFILASNTYFALKSLVVLGSGSTLQRLIRHTLGSGASNFVRIEDVWLGQLGSTLEQIVQIDAPGSLGIQFLDCEYFPPTNATAKLGTGTGIIRALRLRQNSGNTGWSGGSRSSVDHFYNDCSLRITNDLVIGDFFATMCVFTFGAILPSQTLKMTNCEGVTNPFRIEGGSGWIVGCRFASNPGGGLAILRLTSSVQVTDCSFSGYSGVAISVTQANCSIKGCTFTQPNPDHHIEITANGTNCVITGNSFTGSDAFMDSAIEVGADEVKIGGNIFDISLNPRHVDILVGADGGVLASNVFIAPTSESVRIAADDWNIIGNNDCKVLETGTADVNKYAGNSGFSESTIIGPLSKVDGMVRQAVDPGVTNDDTEDFFPGDRWLNTVSGEVFVIVDNTTGAAVWTSVTSGGGSNFDPNAIFPYSMMNALL